MTRLDIQKKKVESVLKILRNRLIYGQTRPLCFSLNNRLRKSIETIVLKRIFQTSSYRYFFNRIGMDTCNYYLGLGNIKESEYFTKRIEFLDYLITRSNDIALACLIWDRVRKINNLPKEQEDFTNHIKERLLFNKRALCPVLFLAPNRFKELSNFALLLLDVICKAPEIRKLTESKLDYFLIDPNSMGIEENRNFRVRLLESLIYLY